MSAKMLKKVSVAPTNAGKKSALELESMLLEMEKLSGEANPLDQVSADNNGPTHQGLAQAKNWMHSEPRIPIMNALNKLQKLHSNHSQAPLLGAARRLVTQDLKRTESDEPSDYNFPISDILEILLTYNIDDDCLEASNIYSGVESLLICPVETIRNKAARLINKWRMSQNLSPVRPSIMAITARTPKQLADMFGPPLQDGKSSFAGVLYGMLWAIELASCDDPVQRCYAKKTLWYSESIVQPGRNPGNISREDCSQKDFEYLVRDIRNSYPMENCWHNIMTSKQVLSTHVDRWDYIAKFGLGNFVSSKPHIESFGATANDKDLSDNDDHTGIAVATRIPMNIPASGATKQYRFENDHSDCETHGDFNFKSKFLLQNASASFRSLMSKIGDEEEHLHNQIDYISLNDFKVWFDDNTRICRGVFSTLETEIEALHSAWPDMLCIIESNVRRSILGKELYISLRETLQNMEDTFDAYSSEAQTPERELAHSDLVSLRARCASCAPEGRYWPSSCDLHRIQDKLMGMICRPIKALWKLECTRREDLARQLEAKTEEISKICILSEKRELTLSKVKSQLSVSELELKTTKTKLDGAERAAAAKAHIEIEKQKSKYYQDVEKGVNESSSALRSQLDAARAEAQLCRQTLADNESLATELSKVKQEMAQLRAIKSQKEMDCKIAKEATKTITEGYEQLKETNESVLTRNVELEADLDKAWEEQELLRSEIDKLKAGKRLTAPPPQASSTDNHAALTPTTLEEKNKKELQHLNSTIVVWQMTLAEAETKRDKTKEIREQVDLRIEHVEKQIKALKELKKPKAKSPAGTTPWGAAAPPAQTPATAPVQSPHPIIVPSAVRKASTETEQFPALGAANATANVLRSEAPAFSSMRIKTYNANGTKANVPAPRSIASKDAGGEKKGYGGGQGQHSGRGGWGN